jgi:O-antigen/teichoic acid export membrane protein
VPERSDQVNLGLAVASGVRWSAAQQVAEQVLRLLLTVVLAHLVAPGDFGLMSMAFVMTQLAIMMSDLGVGAALVQRSVLEERHVRTAFTLSTIAGLLFAGLAVLLSGPIAAWFREPRLEAILVALSATFICKGVQGAPRDLLRRHLRFRPYTMTALVALVAGVITGVVAGLAGAGVWALVAYSLVESTVSAVLSLAVAVRAGLWRPSIGLDRQSLHDLGGFAGYIFGTRAVMYGHSTLDNVIVGRLLGATALGFYGLAYRTMLFPVQKVADVIGNIALPAFSTLQGDRRRLLSAFLRGQQAVSLVCFPMSFSVLVVASLAVPLLLGNQWSPAVATMQILALNGARLALGRLGATAFQAVGKPSWDFWVLAASLPLYVAGFVIGARYGIEGVAIGFTIAGHALVPLQLHLVARALESTVVHVVRPLAGVAVATAVMCGVVLAVRAVVGPVTGDAVELAAAVGAGVASYLAALSILAPGSVRALVDDVSRRASPPDATVPTHVQAVA